MTPVPFDPRAVWRDLAPDAQETIGACAIAWLMGAIVAKETADSAPMDGAIKTAWEVARRTLIDAAQPALFEEDGTARIPDTGGLDR
jgi:hypothetical protein